MKELKNDFYFRTEGLEVGYNGVPLIKDINIGMKKGEILTLIGPNGAGKTTILRSILQQLKPLGGVICIDDDELGKMQPKEISKKMSVVLTRRVRTEMMSCEDVVGTGRYPYTGHFGLLSQEDRRIVKESMETVHVSELADRDFRKISDGQKQRVMLARALCQEPEIILLDEPTSFLDIKYKLEFLSVLQRLSRQKNLTVIMSLHELDLAERVSDKILCVKGDKVDRFGTPEEIFKSGYIAQLYDMTAGSYDENSGNIELEAAGCAESASGEAEIFVIAGGGGSTAVFRQLQREGKAFNTGILWENDIDFPSAKALANELVSTEAFCEVGSEKIERCKELIRNSKLVICAADVSNEKAYNGHLRELVRFAAEEGKLSLKI